MKAFGFSPSFIGICFAVPGVIYAALAPIMYLLTERMPKRLVIVIGTLICAVGMFFVGTSKSLGLENNPAMIVLGLMFLGGSWAIMSIPVLPEMLEAVEMRVDLNYNSEELDNFISGIFVVSNGIGEAIGPLLSSYLNDAYGFREAQDRFAFGIVIYALIYFLCAGHINMLWKTRKERNLTSPVPSKMHIELDEVPEIDFTIDRHSEQRRHQTSPNQKKQQSRNKEEEFGIAEAGEAYGTGPPKDFEYIGGSTGEKTKSN